MGAIIKAALILATIWVVVILAMSIAIPVAVVCVFLGAIFLVGRLILGANP